MQPSPNLSKNNNDDKNGDDDDSDDDALKYTCISRKLAIKSKGIYEFHYKGQKN